MYVCYNTRVIHTTLKKQAAYIYLLNDSVASHCAIVCHSNIIRQMKYNKKKLHKATTFDTRDEVEQFSILFNLIIIFCFTYFDQPIWSMGNGYTFQTNALRFPLMLFHSNSNAFNVIFAFFSFSFFFFLVLCFRV